MNEDFWSSECFNLTLSIVYFSELFHNTCLQHDLSLLSSVCMWKAVLQLFMSCWFLHWRVFPTSNSSFLDGWDVVVRNGEGSTKASMDMHKATGITAMTERGLYYVIYQIYILLFKGLKKLISRGLKLTNPKYTKLKTNINLILKQ